MILVLIPVPIQVPILVQVLGAALAVLPLQYSLARVSESSTECEFVLACQHHALQQTSLASRSVWPV